MVSFTAKAQSDFVVWFRPRNKCPATSLRRSRPLPTNIGSAFSDSLAINAPAGAEDSGSLSEEDVDVEAAPRGTQPASSAGLGPALSAVFPSRRASGWLGGGNLRLRDADGLLRSGRAGRQRRLRGYRIGTGFIAVGKQRGGHAQCLDFLFQSGQLQFFLPQNFINILHTGAPVRERILRTN